MNKSSVHSVDVICPAYEEAGNLKPLVEDFQDKIEIQSREYRLIFVVCEEDPDPTPKIAKSLEQEYDFVTSLMKQKSPSFGSQIKTGLKKATADAVVIMMSDRSDDPKFIPQFIHKLESGYDVIHGSRFLDDSFLQGYGNKKYLFNRVFNYIVRIFFWLECTDFSNAYKGYRSTVVDEIGIENLRSTEFEITIELALKAYLKGFSHTEIPVTWKARDYGESSFTLARAGITYLSRLIDLGNQAIKNRVN